MITTLEIAGFKRFSFCHLDMAPLTVLAGLNNSGKTSIIQALLLMREASLSGSGTVALNGPYGLELGSAEDVLNTQNAPGSSDISLAATLQDGANARFRLDAQELSLLHLRIRDRGDSAALPFGGPERGFTYLCAERLGPRDVLGTSARASDDLGVGVRGEFCAQVLDLLGPKHRVAEPRIHETRRGPADVFLKSQVEAWLSDIVCPVEIDTRWFPGTTVTALRFRSPEGEWSRAPNVGFGVSYALPVVLAGLFAPLGGLVMVENPEAHLHPAGQSRMGVFLAVLAASGVQVVVETHSDHVLNGIRRAIGEKGILQADRALVHFFDAEQDGQPKIATLRFAPTGGLSDWPKSFFDQYPIDVAALSRVRRGPPR